MPDAPWLWTALGYVTVIALLLASGTVLSSQAQDRRLTAMYADAQESVGRVDEVITHPGGGEEQTTYEFLISTDLADGSTLRRRIDWGRDDDWPPPARRVGQTFRFRHNTLDPDDLRDVRFLEGS